MTSRCIFWPQLCQMLTDFRNHFGSRLAGKFAIRSSLNVPLRRKHVACETSMSDKSPRWRNESIKLSCKIQLLKQMTNKILVKMLALLVRIAVLLQAEWRVGMVCRSVCHGSELCKNGWTDRDAVRVEDSGVPKESCVRWESRSPMETGNFEVYQVLKNSVKSGPTYLIACFL